MGKVLYKYCTSTFPISTLTIMFMYIMWWYIYEYHSCNCFVEINSIQFNIMSDVCLMQMDDHILDLCLQGQFSLLYVKFALRRHTGYFLINIYVPCSLLVVLSWVGFWINREATSDRIALGECGDDRD